MMKFNRFLALLMCLLLTFCAVLPAMAEDAPEAPAAEEPASEEVSDEAALPADIETEGVADGDGEGDGVFSPVEEPAGGASIAGMTPLYTATIKPFTVDMPAKLKLEFLRADFCENHLAEHPKYTRLDARAIGNTIDKFDDYTDIVFCG